MNQFECKRCGKCCEQATVCDLRGHMFRPEISFLDSCRFEAPCDQLIRHEDGTCSCNVILDMIRNPDRWNEKGRR